jgi:excisionase family DNA binding protein
MAVTLFDGTLETMDVQELARDLGVHPYTIHGYIRQGALRARRIGHRYIISREAFSDFLNGERTTAGMAVA